MTIRDYKNPSHPEEWPLEYWEMEPVRFASFEDSKVKLYKDLVRLQFELSYHANISIEDSNRMSHPELLLFYSCLKDQKEAEKEAMGSATKSRK